MIKFSQITKNALFLFAVLFLMIGCTKESIYEPSTDTSVMDQFTERASNSQFNASLKGKFEVPSNQSKGAGVGIVRINGNGNKIFYKLNTANIENVLFAHFHYAPAGSNGPVVATLYFNENPQPSGPANGTLAQGYIEEGDVVGPLAGNLDALIKAIRDGNIYINVHTTAYPPGELRGQL